MGHDLQPGPPQPEQAAKLSAEQQANNPRLAWSEFQAGVLPDLIEGVLEIDAEAAGATG